MTASIQSASSGFEKLYGTTAEGVWSAPGRVNLIGEHTDYNEGFVLPFAINRRTFAALRPRTDSVARVGSSFSPELVEIEINKISRQTVSGWSGYPLGVAFALSEYGATAKGFDLFVDSNVPVGAGLSSSAAIECSVALALNELWEAGASLTELALIGQRAENEIVGAPTGIMDQTASLKAEADHAVFIDCQSLETEAIPLGLAENDLEIMIIDSKVAHRLSDGGYASRRSACELGAKSFGVSSLRALGQKDLAKAEKILDQSSLRRVRHVITENDRVLETVKVLKRQGPRFIGKLLYESHLSMRDDFQISIIELDVAVDVAIASGAIGARMTGGGFGGSAIALIEKTLVPQASQAIKQEFESRGFAKPDIFTVVADRGAAREV